ncbi:methyltransferase family protein [Chitinophaga alhagiae]|uniref:methyltransferase family protein n=1 Tax=Chitinophaga alhagiae TaxID=2203219 RepID=UPI000E5B23E4|nr:isoprenylcysteine carboxylmethyltransferase family protein [Chitinophaga alhagiae]
MKAKNSGQASLLLRNLVFTILQPGVVAGLIPYLIMRGRAIPVAPWLHYTGIAVFAAGVIIVLACIVQFALQGAGTLSPADPTQKLVVAGLYRYSRNPMYIGVMLTLLGEALAWGNVYLWLYAAVIFLCFYLFVRYREEPRLHRDFGKEYDDYRKRVRRWL